MLYFLNLKKKVNVRMPVDKNLFDIIKNAKFKSLIK